MPVSFTEHVQSINYTVDGIGPPVILVHGIAASLYDWRELVPELARQSYQAFAVDLLGHGESPQPENHDHYHFESLFAHLEAWIANLRLDQPPLLVGHSLGGSLCLKFALQHAGAVQGLVLIDPFFSLTQLSPALRFLNRRPNLGEKALRMAPVWLIKAITRLDVNSPDCAPSRSRRQIAEDYKRASPKITHIVGTVPELLPHLHEIVSPTLVIWGEKDLTLDPGSFPRLVGQLPNARGHLIEGCGHQPHLGQPERVNRLILDFLNQHTRTGI